MSDERVKPIPDAWSEWPNGYPSNPGRADEDLPQRAGRAGDSQGMPTPNDNPHIHDLVAADLQKRKELGTQRYGTPLQAHNNRNALQDAYEEALDLCVYLRQALEEQR
jgi:hypothetical protein